MPATNVQFMNRNLLLTFEEIEQVVQLLAPLGVNKIRLTGGEPLVRQDLPLLIEKLVQVNGIEDVGLTTNGILLADAADDLKKAGLARINISLDALDPVKFEQVTRRKGYEKVLEGIEAAQKAGFDPIKINAVAIRGITETELIPFGQLARDTGMEIRFIEFMPLDADNAWERDKVLRTSEMIEILTDHFGPLNPIPAKDTRAPASDYQFADGKGKIGFISSISQPFCLSCNRFRLTADGKLRNCLFSLEETDIKTLIRSGSNSEEILQAVADCIATKKEGHEINTARFIQPDRPMYSIGG